jgi:hypothetical protein
MIAWRDILTALSSIQAFLVLGAARPFAIPELSLVDDVRWAELKQHLALFAFAATVPFTGLR